MTYMKTGKSTSSPHPWGCFRDIVLFTIMHEVFPTPVGVFPVKGRIFPAQARLPHTRGGVSPCGIWPRCASLSSPHPWGCFREMTYMPCARCVFPTPVGVFLINLFFFSVISSLPHTRGGVSGLISHEKGKGMSSPHPWGCFFEKRLAMPAGFVFPTPVGVFPTPRSTRPKACWSSPHPWGCFSSSPASSYACSVFPTPVGVFLPRLDIKPARHSLPHTRGGVSCRTVRAVRRRLSSPHPWGCFCMPSRRRLRSEVFPTPVGVFPIQAFVCPDGYRLPHTRGGVSGRQDALECCCLSSPHPWGCFRFRLSSALMAIVFPTPVGVFLQCGCVWETALRLPHTRGGVSCAVFQPFPRLGSSPHPWGCF